MNPKLFFSIVFLFLVTLACQFLGGEEPTPLGVQPTAEPQVLATAEDLSTATAPAEEIDQSEATSTVEVPAEADGEMTAPGNPLVTDEITPETPLEDTQDVNDDATATAEASGSLSAKEYAKRGDGYLDEEKYQEAIDDYTLAIGLDGKNQSAFWHRGIAYYALMEYDKALQDMDTTIKLWPGQPNPYYWRGLIYHDMGEYKKAIVEYDLAIEKTKAAHWTNTDWNYILEARQKAESALNQ